MLVDLYKSYNTKGLQSKLNLNYFYSKNNNDDDHEHIILEIFNLPISCFSNTFVFVSLFAWQNKTKYSEPGTAATD